MSRYSMMPCLFLLCCIHTIHGAFVAPSRSSKPGTQIFVSQPFPDEEVHVFGRPLDEGTKELNKKLVNRVKSVIFDTFFAEDTMERAFARFWTLETIARMPYFSYLSVLHLYETLGWWRRADYLKIHFMQTWNEQHHLLIMEELHGNHLWFDRFLAQHIAVSYFFLCLAFFVVNPTFAYNFNQAVEEEAYQTYNNFLAKNEAFLKDQPAPSAAIHYYLEDPLFEGMGSRPRPAMTTLLDTFTAIRDDEAEHAETMLQMQNEAL